MVAASPTDLDTRLTVRLHSLLFTRQHVYHPTGAFVLQPYWAKTLRWRHHAFTLGCEDALLLGRRSASSDRTGNYVNSLKLLIKRWMPNAAIYLDSHSGTTYHGAGIAAYLTHHTA